MLKGIKVKEYLVSSLARVEIRGLLYCLFFYMYFLCFSWISSVLTSLSFWFPFLCYSMLSRSRHNLIVEQLWRKKVIFPKRFYKRSRNKNHYSYLEMVTIHKTITLAWETECFHWSSQGHVLLLECQDPISLI